MPCKSKAPRTASSRVLHRKDPIVCWLCSQDFRGILNMASLLFYQICTFFIPFQSFPNSNGNAIQIIQIQALQECEAPWPNRLRKIWACSFTLWAKHFQKKSDFVSASRSASCKEPYLVRSKKKNTSFSTYNVEVCHRRCAMSSMLTIAPEWTRAWDMCTACKADQNKVPKFCRRDILYIYQLLFNYHYYYLFIYYSYHVLNI